MLHRKMLRDFRNHFGQFISVFLLSFLAMCLFTGVSGEVVGVEEAREKYHKQTNLADGWIYGDDFSKEQVNAVATLSDVRDVQRRQYMEGKSKNDTMLFLYFQDENIVNTPLVLKGKEYDPNDKEGIWLCYRFAMEQNIAVGDEIEITIEGINYIFHVAGLVWSPEYEYYKNEVDLEPNYENTGYGFSAIDALQEEHISFNQLIFTSESGLTSEMEHEIASALDNQYSVLVKRDGINNLTTLDNEIEQHKMMAIIFPAFFMIIAVLTTVTTMKRIVDRQRIQIGTLKALGMKKRKIYFHYLGYGFFTSLAGVVLGTALGPISISPLLFHMKYYLDSSDEYMLPHFDVIYSLHFWLVGLFIVAVCTTSTWLSCRKILKITPAVALRPAQPKSSQKTIFEKLPFWTDLNFSIRYNLRDIAKNKERTLFGLAGTTSCMALLLCAFAAKDNFQNAVADLYVGKLMNQSSMVTMSTETPIEEAEKLRNLSEGELIMSDTVEIRLPESIEKYSYHMNVYEQGQVANVLNEELEVAKISGTDFTLTKKTAETLGVSVGDTVEWHIYDSQHWVTSEVTMICRAPFEQGIVTTRGALEAVGYSFTPTRLITQKDINESWKEQSAFISDVTTKDGMRDLLRNYMEMINLVIGFMLVFAVFLVVIVLYSLGLLSYEERRKEMATLKVLGFGTQKLRKLMMQQNVILGIFGALLGIPLGSLLVRILIQSMGDAMDIPTSCNLIYIVISFVTTVVVSVAVNGVFSKRIKNMDMVEEIKAME